VCKPKRRGKGKGKGCMIKERGRWGCAGGEKREKKRKERKERGRDRVSGTCVKVLVVRRR
jgi:hypothetical protein